MTEPTDEEVDVLANKDFLLLKSSVSEKVTAYLADIERALHQEIKASDFPFPKGTFLRAGKISKGENYRLLPYFILDYPRLFSNKQVFAFRSMVWWGNHFSCTLHLSGPILDDFRSALLQNLPKNPDLYFCVNSQPWEYHYGRENYRQIKDLTTENIVHQLEQNHFVKISNFIAVSEWDRFKSFTLKSFARFLQCLY